MSEPAKWRYQVDMSQIRFPPEEHPKADWAQTAACRVARPLLSVLEGRVSHRNQGILLAALWCVLVLWCVARVGLQYKSPPVKKHGFGAKQD